MVKDYFTKNYNDNNLKFTVKKDRNVSKTKTICALKQVNMLWWYDIIV